MTEKHPTPMARPTRRRMVGFIAAGIVGLALATAPTAFAAAPPEQFIQKLGNETVGVLTKTNSNDKQRIQSISKLLNQATDLPLISRLVLGRYWRTATSEQRQDYVRLFHGYALNSLAQRFNGYTGSERFKITGSRKLDDTDSLVSTEIYTPNRPKPINVDWRVRRTDGRDAIIDVVAEGVSMVITNRAQVDSIVSRKGMDGLLQEMRGWAGSEAS